VGAKKPQYKLLRTGHPRTVKVTTKMGARNGGRAVVKNARGAKVPRKLMSKDTAGTTPAGPHNGETKRTGAKI